MTKKFNIENYIPEDLLQAGIDHLFAAKLLLNNKPRLYDSAGYLAHIGIELLLKSWLLHINHEFEGIHSLNKLVKQLKKFERSLTFTDRESRTIAYLSNFENLRYQRKDKPIEIGDEDIEQINEIANALWQQMPDALVNAYCSLPVNRKCGRVLMERPSHIERDLKFETGIDQ